MQRTEGKPYGPAYQRRCEAILIENGVSTSAMAAFYFLCLRIDWDTGVMPHQLSHNALGRHIGAKYNAVYRAIRQLRLAGVLDYAQRGDNYDGGDANIYRFAVPTPTPKEGGGAHQKRADPHTKTGRLNPSPSLSEGKKDAPSRRGGDKAPDENSGEMRQFSADVTRHGYIRAKELAAERAAQEDGANAPAMK